MSVHTTFAKTPTAIRDYAVNWGTNAPGDDLSSVSWSVPAGLTTVDTGMDGGRAIIRLSGGALDGIYLVRAVGTRASGQIDRRSFYVAIVPYVVEIKAMQDPNAKIDYTLDLDDLFGDDPIDSLSWSASGITIDGATTASTVRLTGGAAGAVAYATCHAVSDGGQEDDRSIEITLQDL